MKHDENTKSGKKPLFTKVNTVARRVCHNSGGEYRHDRNSKKQPESERQSMGKKEKRGLDYTPLYKFLLSKVSQDWNSVHSEAVSRLDTEEPIFYMVAILEQDKVDIFQTSQFTYFNGLFVDENNILQIVNPNITLKDVPVWCTCCTFSLNGIRVPRKEDPKKLFEM